MKVTLEKEIVEDLISYKKIHIEKLIEKILERWNENSIDQFLERAKKGIFSEAENDAIEIRQLLIEEEKLRILLENLKS
ncbi:MAG: hypothetical protein ACTSRG_01570 [Candidatus Helarchaeota archaeon]